MTLPEHFFINSNGDLHDTRMEDWASHPVREKYAYTYAEINNLDQLKATLRNGAVSQLGGYPLYFITNDGCALSFKAVLECWSEVVLSFMWDMSDGWRVVACDVNCENTDLFCDHTGERIPSAYGDD